ncbi:hypothetical protein Fmac_020327 [Flemingia macrophylla]|uniref:C2H2-type domain-containing protein n=1 Tax=Flemingia macrophylla TaxID=520843 RepID=A0ABD1LVK3_9FABA
MDKTTERETHDFMNVDSFSQLPFIRPAPPLKEKSGIRLFGIEFAGGNSNSSVSADDSVSAETSANNNSNNNNNSVASFDPKDEAAVTTTTTTVADTNGESSRRFECHYCCRNFPTSQALGGHQNAHKRERQHAKRAHLQSTMVHGSTYADPHHVYNLMNYRFGSAPTPPPMPYPTWNNTATNTTRFYGTTSFSHHHHHQNQNQQQQQPINGSPLAFWRIPGGGSNNPSFSHERSTLPPLFASEEITNVRGSHVVGASGSQNRYVYDSKRGSVHDHVSLDLHL